MRKCPTSVIPSAARDLVFSATYEEEISRLHLEMTVATQSVDGGRLGWGHDLVARTNPHLNPPPSRGRISDWGSVS